MIRRIEHIDDLGQIKDACNDLADFLGRPFLRYEWLEFFAKAFYPPNDLKVLVRDGWGGISGIAPFAAARNNPNGGVELLGTGYFPLPSGILFKDESALAELTSEAFTLPFPLNLNGLEPESPEVRAFENQSKDALHVRHRRMVTIPWMPISGSWANYLRHLSPEKIACLRVYRDIAGSLGEITVEIKSPSADLSDQFITEVRYQEEQGRWRPTPAALFLHDKVVEHFKDFARNLARSQMLRVGILKINDEWTAVHVGFEYRKRLWSLGMFCDKRWDAWCPDALLIHQTIRCAFENRLHAIEVADGDRSRFQLSNALTKKIYDYRFSQTEYPLSPLRDKAVQLFSS